jgi:hypothetical protein
MFIYPKAKQPKKGVGYAVLAVASTALRYGRHPSTTKSPLYDVAVIHLT